MACVPIKLAFKCSGFAKNTSCIVKPGCHWCPLLEECRSISVSCDALFSSLIATSDVESNNSGISDDDNNSDDKGMNPTVMWVIIGCAGGGGALLIAASAIIVACAIAHRRKRGPKTVVEMVGVKSMTTGLLSGLTKVTAEELGLEFSKSTLTFGTGKKSMIKVDVPIEDQLEIKNTSKTEAVVTIHVPTEAEAEGKFEMRAMPWEVTISSGDKMGVTITMTPHCTTTLKTAIAFWRKPFNSYATVEVEAMTELSSKLDWNEIALGPELGKGGFGIVYRATWRGMPVAVKEMNSTLWDIQDTRDDILREVDLMSRLRSPFIICFHGVVISPAHKAIVMELSPMGSLLSILRKQELSMEAKIKIAKNCARGMLVLHENSILHRDLKPDNLLVFSLNPSDEVLVKLTDFGTSRAVADDQSRQYTKGVGTPIYMAPELVKGKPYGKAADVYSYGVLL
jgi:tRNA A-37 threonylcarbamoyl transferase component Bud32